MSDVELRFEIGAYTPETFPMERLGQYLIALGAMLGETDSVHFVKLEKGSTKIVHRVEEEALPGVEQHIFEVRQGVAEVVHLDAYRAVNLLLKEDNTDAALVRDDSDAQILHFPGRAMAAPPPPDIVSQPGHLDGTVISLGGRDTTVPVRVQNDGTIYRCSTTREVARQLGAHIFGEPLRLSGEGKWIRSSDGTWKLDVFKIYSFDRLDTRSLLEVVADLRAVGGEWQSVDDPWAELQALRDGDEEQL